jgi:two-component system chemotaxis response regulator CheB
VGTRIELVVVGTSAGGLRALARVLAGLPPRLAAPIVVVQHRARAWTDAYPKIVGASSALVVNEAEDGEPLLPGHVYIGPPDYHVLVEPGRIALSTDPPVLFSRPSIDVLFASAADAYGEGLLAVLLTGASRDGARGLQRVKAAGGAVIVQDPRTAESPTMPSAGIAGADVDCVLPLGAIADEIILRSSPS